MSQTRHEVTEKPIEVTNPKSNPKPSSLPSFMAGETTRYPYPNSERGPRTRSTGTYTGSITDLVEMTSRT